MQDVTSFIVHTALHHINDDRWSSNPDVKNYIHRNFIKQININWKFKTLCWTRCIWTWYILEEVNVSNFLSFTFSSRLIWRWVFVKNNDASTKINVHTHNIMWNMCKIKINGIKTLYVFLPLSNWYPKLVCV